MMRTARQLFDAVGEKFASQFPRLLLRGDRGSGYSPGQYGGVEHQGEHYLSLKTATAETKGIASGVGVVGFLIGVIGALIGIAGAMEWRVTLFALAMGCGMFMTLFLWELYRPFPLPIIFNRRTQEIYYDLNGKLYHVPWEGIEAVTYEYRNVNQYAGSMPHANLDLILQRFGDPEDRIALNIGGHTSGKRVETLARLWEYLRAYMNEGPWFDEHGNRTVQKSPFIIEQLKKSGYSSKNNLKEARAIVQQYKDAGDAVPGGLQMEVFSNFFFHPMSLMESFTYRICRDRSDKQWPAVVRERLEPDGPTTRLVDIEQHCD